MRKILGAMALVLSLCGPVTAGTINAGTYVFTFTGQLSEEFFGEAYENTCQGVMTASDWCLTTPGFPPERARFSTPEGFAALDAFDIHTPFAALRQGPVDGRMVITLGAALQSDTSYSEDDTDFHVECSLGAVNCGSHRWGDEWLRLTRAADGSLLPEFLISYGGSASEEFDSTLYTYRANDPLGGLGSQYDGTVDIIDFRQVASTNSVRPPGVALIPVGPGLAFLPVGLAALALVGRRQRRAADRV